MGLNFKTTTKSIGAIVVLVVLAIISGIVAYLGFHILINQFWNLEPVETFLVFWFVVFIVEKLGKK